MLLFTLVEWSVRVVMEHDGRSLLRGELPERRGHLRCGLGQLVHRLCQGRRLPRPCTWPAPAANLERRPPGTRPGGP